MLFRTGKTPVSGRLCESVMNALKIALGMSLFACSGMAHSNLIVNGGFEKPGISSGWTYGPDAEGGWRGDDIEVWASEFKGVKSFEGEQHGELNAHGRRDGAWSIHQSFDTLVDSRYAVSFAYRARKHDQEAFRFEIYSGVDEIFNFVMDRHDTDQWSIFSDTFAGSGALTTLKFTAITPSTGTVGNFIDAVSVTPLASPLRIAQEVPAPSTLLLLAAGLAAIRNGRSER
jgi:hypothetical protein